MATSLELLYNYLYPNNIPEENSTYIKICENNLHTITVDNTENYSDDEYLLLITIISRYSLILASKDNFPKAMPFLTRSIKLWSEHGAAFNTDLLEQQEYEFLCFQKARGNFLLKNYNIAATEFKQLTKAYPDNIIYKNWLQTTLYRKLTYLSITLVVIGFGCSLIKKIVFTEGPIYDLSSIASTIFITSGLAVFVFQYLFYKKK